MSNSNTLLTLSNIPEVSDPEVYKALLVLTQAVDSNSAVGDSSLASFTTYVNRLNNTIVVTSDYSVLATNSTIMVDASAGSIIVTMPIIANVVGYRFEIKRVDTNTANKVTLVGRAGELIDNRAAGINISTKSSYTLKPNNINSGWVIL